MRCRRLVVFGLDCLWFGAGWNEVRHEAAEDVRESHPGGSRRCTAEDIGKTDRCGQSNGKRRGPSLVYIWAGSCELCSLLGAFFLVGAIPALGRSWRKAGLGATDMEQRVGGLGDAGETPVSASRINAENAQDFPQYCLKEPLHVTFSRCFKRRSGARNEAAPLMEGQACVDALPS